MDGRHEVTVWEQGQWNGWPVRIGFRTRVNALNEEQGSGATSTLLETEEFLATRCATSSSPRERIARVWKRMGSRLLRRAH